MTLTPFHDHLERCDRCRRQPFNLCAVGAQLLEHSFDTPGRFQQRDASDVPSTTASGEKEVYPHFDHR